MHDISADVLTAVGKPFEKWTIQIDEPRGREVLVDVKGSGLCHSDLHIQEDDYGFPLPAVLGHEIAGVVMAVGPEVSGLKVGDHVVGCLVQSCGHCDRCLAGDLESCRNPFEVMRGLDDPPRLSKDGQPIMQAFGLGGFAEQALVHERQLVKVPDDIPFDRAAILGCGVVTGAGAAIHSGDVRVGDRVAIIGCGGVGLNAVQGAALAGARQVIAVDLEPTKLQLARKFGATHIVNPADGDPVQQVMTITGGLGVDKAFEIIGLKPTLEQAVGMLGPRGTAYIVGMQKPGATLTVGVDLADPRGIAGRQGAVRGVFMGSTNFFLDIPLYAELYQQGRFNLDDLVSQDIRLEDINAGYDQLKTGKVARSVMVFA